MTIRPTPAETPLSNLGDLIRNMKPILHPGIHVFCRVPHGLEVPHLNSHGMFREKEGVTLILEEEVAQEKGLEILYRAAWITLMVHSDLYAVGFLAAVLGLLARNGISCNVISGASHDHLFVPLEKGLVALTLLLNFQDNPST